MLPNIAPMPPERNLRFLGERCRGVINLPFHGRNWLIPFGRRGICEVGPLPLGEP